MFISLRVDEDDDETRKTVTSIQEEDETAVSAN
jgi:hypothetical protein